MQDNLVHKIHSLRGISIMVWWRLTLFANNLYKTRNDKTLCLGACQVFYQLCTSGKYYIGNRSHNCLLCCIVMWCYSSVWVPYSNKIHYNEQPPNKCFPHMITVRMYMRLYLSIWMYEFACRYFNREPDWIGIQWNALAKLALKSPDPWLP